MQKPSLPRLPERPEKFRHLPPSPYAPLFIEKLILAIIEANEASHKQFGVKSSTHLPGLRLQRAIHALFAVKRRTVPINDVPQLVAIAQSKLREASEWQHQVRMEGLQPSQATTPFSELADAEGETHTDAQGRADYARLQRKAKEPQYLDYWYQVTNELEHPEENEMQKDLRAIAAILARWGVNLELDPDRLGLHSLSHSWPPS